MLPTRTTAALLLGAASALFATAAAAQGGVACSGTDGLYATANDNYRVEVTFAPGKMTVVEPNRSSTYTHVSGCTFAFTNPNNGIRYLMDVTRDGLSAYKPDTPNNRTPLRLVRAAARGPQAAGACRAAEIPVHNPQALHPGLTRLYGVREIPGVQVVGRYLNEGTGNPVVELRPDGTGIFEMHGEPQAQYRYNIRWWVQANCDGTLVAQEHPAAHAYLLVVEYDREYQGNRWDRVQLAVQKDPAGRVFVLDRSKPKQ